jgi:hypothetical protein
VIGFTVDQILISSEYVAPGLKGFEVDISFLWVHQGKRDRSEVEEKLKEDGSDFA